MAAAKDPIKAPDRVTTREWRRAFSHSQLDVLAWRASPAPGAIASSYLSPLLGDVIKGRLSSKLSWRPAMRDLFSHNEQARRVSQTASPFDNVDRFVRPA